MRWRVELSPHARRQLRKLDPSMVQRIDAAIGSLMVEARPVGAKKLTGETNLWRIRTGDWRIVYTINDDVVLVTVLRIAHRRDIYRQ